MSYLVAVHSCNKNEITMVSVHTSYDEAKKKLMEIDPNATITNDYDDFENEDAELYRIDPDKYYKIANKRHRAAYSCSCNAYAVIYKLVNGDLIAAENDIYEAIVC